MADGTKIEWTEATWNPITGCTVAGPGCRFCYAMTLAGTRMKHHSSREGLTKPGADGPLWTGEVRFNDQWLDQPLRWKAPREIFVNAHGDTFHENVPDEWIDLLFAVMALAPRHIFQVLTKRADRMRAYITALPDRGASMGAAFAHVVKAAKLNPKVGLAAIDTMVWPLPNVWLGVSAENQTAWNARVPDLQATPAAVRWISAEPLIGPIEPEPFGPGSLDELDWIVVGGESDRLGRARPMHPDWVRALRFECKNVAGQDTAFFFKQWGDWGPVGNAMPGASAVNMAGAVRVMDSPPINGEAAMRRDGKVTTGRFLDGRTWDEMPEVAK